MNGAPSSERTARISFPHQNGQRARNPARRRHHPDNCFVSCIPCLGFVRRQYPGELFDDRDLHPEVVQSTCVLAMDFSDESATLPSPPPLFLGPPTNEVV